MDQHGYVERRDPLDGVAVLLVGADAELAIAEELGEGSADPLSQLYDLTWARFRESRQLRAARVS